MSRADARVDFQHVVVTLALGLRSIAKVIEDAFPPVDSSDEIPHPATMEQVLLGVLALNEGVKAVLLSDDESDAPAEPPLSVDLSSGSLLR